MSIAIRHDWTRDQATDLLDAPLLELVHRAAEVHRTHNDVADIQLSALLSIKTGGCPEDCAYCPQSAHYAKQTGLSKRALMAVDEVMRNAEKARAAGADRFCMGAAWRQVRDGEQFDTVLEMVRGVRGMGMEACVTLGMLTTDQAERLARAGLTSYNHNLDTGPEYYDKIISTRTYEDRLNTLQHVRDAGIKICSGGIIGMGEGVADRADMLVILANMDPQPESVPINSLVAVKGTPLQDQDAVDPLDFVRMIATARIMLPKTRVRLSAGRQQLSKEAQTLCFMAGANSIFYGDTLLTTSNPEINEDAELLKELGAKAPRIVSEEADAQRYKVSLGGCGTSACGGKCPQAAE